MSPSVVGGYLLLVIVLGGTVTTDVTEKGNNSFHEIDAETSTRVCVNTMTPRCFIHSYHFIQFVLLLCFAVSNCSQM